MHAVSLQCHQKVKRTYFVEGVEFDFVDWCVWCVYGISVHEVQCTRFQLTSGAFVHTQRSADNLKLTCSLFLTY